MLKLRMLRIHESQVGLMSSFVKMHKDELNELGDVFDKFFEKIEEDLA